MVAGVWGTCFLFDFPGVCMCGCVCCVEVTIVCMLSFLGFSLFCFVLIAKGKEKSVRLRYKLLAQALSKLPLQSLLCLKGNHIFASPVPPL